MTYLERMVVDGLDQEKWREARVGKIGGSDAASFAKVSSAPLYLRAKLLEGFTGNQYTRHGKEREPVILSRFNLKQNLALFHAAGNPLHVCTPDAIVAGPDEIVLVQVKTSAKPLSEDKLSPAYKRQMWWEQYVMGARRTLFVWEVHDNFTPLGMEPDSFIFERDDSEIENLITIADLVLEGMATAAQFRQEMNS